MENKTFRTFSSGSSRDSDTGKLEYSNYIHPIADYSFAEYMKSKQIIGGEYRRGDNWQKGIPYESLFESLIRHTELLKLLYKGYEIIEYKLNGEVMLYISKDEEMFNNMLDIIQTKDGYTDIQIKNIESELNAIRFNGEAMKIQFIEDNFISQ